MSAEILQRIRLTRCFPKAKMKCLCGAILVVLALQLQQVNAQDLILQDTTITTAAAFSANSISSGPNFTITGSGNVTFGASTVYLRGKFIIENGGQFKILNGPVSGIEIQDDRALPIEFSIGQNYPNPFNPSTKIKFALPKSEFVKIEVYNLTGQKVETLLNQLMKAGHHEVEFYGLNKSSGLYFYTIQAGEYQDVKKMVLIK